VIHPRTEEILMVVGVDVEAKDWEVSIARARLSPIVFSLAMLLILLTAYATLEWRKHQPYERQWGLRHMEAGLCAILGLAITLAVACRVHESEVKLRLVTFSTLARSQIGSIIESLRDIRTRLSSLGRFIVGREEMSRNDFQTYTQPLIQDGLAQAWEWVPAVSANKIASVESLAHREGLTNFALYQKDAQGRKEPVSGRETYYPVLFAEPPVGNEKAFGYDLGSEAIRRVALMEAANTLLATATDPIILVQETAKQQGLLAFQPVFNNEATQRTLRGFAMVVLRLESVLSCVIQQTTQEEMEVSASIFQLEPGRQARLAAASVSNNHAEEIVGRGRSSSTASMTIGIPLFLFGKSYLVEVRAEPRYLASHPLLQGWVALRLPRKKERDNFLPIL
jgi:CHASE1-domain containing sensor protein